MTTPEAQDDADKAVQDMLDALDDLVDDTPPETAPASAPDPVLRIDHPVQIRETVAEVIPIEDARTRRNLRADLVVNALHAAGSAMAVIRKAFNDGTADFDDAAKALPQLHRIIEHVEKIEVAAKKRDPYENLPMFDFRRLPGGGFSYGQIKPPEAAGIFDDLDAPDSED